jgi:hypothetical protein
MDNLSFWHKTRVQELIFLHLNFSDVIALTQVSSKINKTIAKSKNCLKKVNLSLTKRSHSEINEFLSVIQANPKRYYQNVKVNAYGDHYTTESYMTILKTLERCILQLDVEDASYRWDEINTRNFHDQWLILTDLQQLTLKNVNEFTAEIFFISCTYLKSLTLERIHMSKYLTYCLEKNEKLEKLIIIDALHISQHIFNTKYDFKFKLYHFKFDYSTLQLAANIYHFKNTFMDSFTEDLLLQQIENLKSAEISGMTFDGLFLVFDKLNKNNFIIAKMQMNETPVDFEVIINNLKFKALKREKIQNLLCNPLVNFFDNQYENLQEIELSCECESYIIKEYLNMFFNKFNSLRKIYFKGNFNSEVISVNDKIWRIETSLTSIFELCKVLLISPKLKELRVFELSMELLNILRDTNRELSVIEYHYISQECMSCDKTFIQTTYLDPVLRICSDLHWLLFQHLDEHEIFSLSTPWTAFYFK